MNHTSAMSTAADDDRLEKLSSTTSQVVQTGGPHKRCREGESSPRTSVKTTSDKTTSAKPTSVNKFRRLENGSKQQPSTSTPSLSASLSASSPSSCSSSSSQLPIQQQLLELHIPSPDQLCPRSKVDCKQYQIDLEKLYTFLCSPEIQELGGFSLNWVDLDCQLQVQFGQGLDELINNADDWNKAVWSFAEYLMRDGCRR